MPVYVWILEEIQNPEKYGPWRFPDRKTNETTKETQ